MATTDYAFVFEPTVNVDVGGRTTWSITGGTPDYRIWRWSCNDASVVRLEVDSEDSRRCVIYGLAGGETVIRAEARDGSGSLSQEISAGLMFVWGADGKLYAATASSFLLTTPEQQAALTRTIPTQEQMVDRAAFFVPPEPMTSSLNVTCYVVNLVHIKNQDVWPPVEPTEEPAKK